MTEDSVSISKKFWSAMLFGITSFFITVINKTILTTYEFPSFLFLTLGQMGSTIMILYICKEFNLISFPDISKSTVRKICPLPLIFFGNVVFGLGGTQELSLPMFTALRRFSIFMTMILETFILKMTPSCAVQISVYAMITGALLAAFDDLSFNVGGYTYVMITNALTAAYGVYIKQKLDCSDIGKYGLMFYNALFMFLPALIVTYIVGDFKKAFFYSQWTDAIFLIQFLLSCIMGLALNYSMILCTAYNSPLTAAIVGGLKNICVTYVGMFIGGDYVFSWLNCIGLNVSVVGSLLYTYVTFREKSISSQQTIVAKSDKIPLV